MSECLLTTLKSAVDDNEMLKLNEFKMHKITEELASTAIAKCLYISPGNQEVTVTFLGDGYATDRNRTQNLGKTVTVPQNRLKYPVYVSPGEYDIIITGKALILNLSNDGTAFLINAESLLGLKSLAVFRNRILGDIKYLKYISPDLEIFANRNNEGVYGDISVFADFPKLTHVDIGRQSVIKNEKIKGNISAFSNKTQLETLNLSNTAVSGNLNSLIFNTALTTLDLSSTDVIGTTEVLAGLENLTTFTYTNTAITGTWPLT